MLNNNSPQSKILLFSILPRGSGTNDPETTRNNVVNQIIKNYHGYFNIKFIDIGNSYIKRSGELIEELFTDRLHLSEAGYAIWKDKIIDVVNNWGKY
jgi:lysophospholipase L1-like esterase